MALSQNHGGTTDNLAPAEMSAPCPSASQLISGSMAMHLMLPAAETLPAPGTDISASSAVPQSPVPATASLDVPANHVSVDCESSVVTLLQSPAPPNSHPHRLAAALPFALPFLTRTNHGRALHATPDLSCAVASFDWPQPDLRWMDRRGPVSGLRRVVGTSLALAVSGTDTFDPSWQYEVPRGYRWATCAEVREAAPTSTEICPAYMGQAGWHRCRYPPEGPSHERTAFLCADSQVRMWVWPFSFSFSFSFFFFFFFFSFFYFCFSRSSVYN